MKAEKNPMTDSMIDFAIAVSKASTKAYENQFSGELEQLIFGMNGMKNKIHNGIRACLSNARVNETMRVIELVFGDTKKAMQEFNALGQI